MPKKPPEPTNSELLAAIRALADEVQELKELHRALLALVAAGGVELAAGRRQEVAAARAASVLVDHEAEDVSAEIAGGSAHHELLAVQTADEFAETFH